MNDGQPFLNLGFINAGAISAKKKFSYIGWYRILPFKLPNKIFADEVPLERLSGDLVQSIELHFNFPQ